MSEREYLQYMWVRENKSIKTFSHTLHYSPRTKKSIGVNVRL